MKRTVTKPTLLLILLMLSYGLDKSNKYIETPEVVTPEVVTPEVVTQKVDVEHGYIDYIIYSLSNMRVGFKQSHGDAGSVIDGDKQFKNTIDFISYLPRAIQIGGFSPFPNDWFKSGKHVGLIGRMLSGIEMIIWYTVSVGFLYILINNFIIMRPLIPIIFISIFLIVLLGYAVPNVGAIFRMRQGYMIPIYIYGMYGVQIIYNKYSIFRGTKKSYEGNFK